MKARLWMIGAVFMLPYASIAGETVGLGQVLHAVEKASPQLSAAQAQADAAKAGVAVVRSQYWGHAELFGRDTHYNNARLVNPISPPINFATFSTDKNQFGYGAMLTLPIDIDGRITAAVHAQEHQTQAATFQVASTRLNLFSQVTSLYRGLQKVSGTRQALQKQYEALQAHRKVTQVSIRVGRLARVELLRIDAEIKSLEGRMASLQGDESRLRATLAALLNQSDFSGEIATPKSRPEGLFASDEVLNQRPDIQGASRLVQAQDESLKRVKREWLPSLSVQAVTSRNQGYNAPGANTWSVMTQLTWQVWDGGRRSAHADQMRAKREAARQQQLSLKNSARAALDGAKAAWHAAQLRYEAAQAGVLAAMEAEHIQSARYQKGRLSAVDLLDAEAALSQARASLSAAMADWWLADDQLHLAVGQEPVAYQSHHTHESVSGGAS